MLTDSQWLIIHTNAKEIVSRTNSYKDAIAMAGHHCNLFDWDADIYTWVITTIQKLHNRKSPLIGSKVNK